MTSRHLTCYPRSRPDSFGPRGVRHWRSSPRCSSPSRPRASCWASAGRGSRVGAAWCPVPSRVAWFRRQRRRRLTSPGPSPSPTSVEAVVTCVPEAGPLPSAMEGDPCPEVIAAVRALVEPLGTPVSIYVEAGAAPCLDPWDLPGDDVCFGPIVLPGTQMHGWVTFADTDKVAAVSDLPGLPGGRRRVAVGVVGDPHCVRGPSGRIWSGGSVGIARPRDCDVPARDQAVAIGAGWRPVPRRDCSCPFCREPVRHTDSHLHRGR